MEVRPARLLLLRLLDLRRLAGSWCFEDETFPSPPRPEVVRASFCTVSTNTQITKARLRASSRLLFAVECGLADEPPCQTWAPPLATSALVFSFKQSSSVCHQGDSQSSSTSAPLRSSCLAGACLPPECCCYPPVPVPRYSADCRSDLDIQIFTSTPRLQTTRGLPTSTATALSLSNTTVSQFYVLTSRPSS